MAYPQTLGDLIDDTLSRVALPANSPAGQFAPGTGEAPTVSTRDTVRQYLNEGGAEFCRTCYPLRAAASAAVAAGTRYVSFASLVVDGGPIMWAVRSAAWDASPLKHSSVGYIEHWNPTWLTDAAGTPTDWYETGDDGIGLYKKPSLDGTLSVDGLVIPARMVEDDDPAPFTPDLNILLVFNAAARLAEKNTHDGSMAERIAEWKGEWAAQIARRQAVLWQKMPELAAAHFPPPASK